MTQAGKDVKHSNTKTAAVATNDAEERDTECFESVWGQSDSVLFSSDAEGMMLYLQRRASEAWLMTRRLITSGYKKAARNTTPEKTTVRDLLTRCHQLRDNQACVLPACDAMWWVHGLAVLDVSATHASGHHRPVFQYASLLAHWLPFSWACVVMSEWAQFVQAHHQYTSTLAVHVYRKGAPLLSTPTPTLYELETWTLDQLSSHPMFHASASVPAAVPQQWFSLRVIDSRYLDDLTRIYTPAILQQPILRYEFHTLRDQLRGFVRRERDLARASLMAMPLDRIQESLRMAFADLARPLLLPSPAWMSAASAAAAAAAAPASTSIVPVELPPTLRRYLDTMTLSIRQRKPVEVAVLLTWEAAMRAEQKDAWSMQLLARQRLLQEARYWGRRASQYTITNMRALGYELLLPCLQSLRRSLVLAQSLDGDPTFAVRAAGAEQELTRDYQDWIVRQRNTNTSEADGQADARIASRSAVTLPSISNAVRAEVMVQAWANMETLLTTFRAWDHTRPTHTHELWARHVQRLEADVLQHAVLAVQRAVDSEWKAPTLDNWEPAAYREVRDLLYTWNDYLCNRLPQRVAVLADRLHVRLKAFKTRFRTQPGISVAQQQAMRGVMFPDPVTTFNVSERPASDFPTLSELHAVVQLRPVDLGRALSPADLVAWLLHVSSQR